MADQPLKVVYVVLGAAGLESVWSQPLPAIEAREKHPSSAYVTVRPVDHTVPTEESEHAMDELRRMERDRHNEQARRRRQRR